MTTLTYAIIAGNLPSGIAFTDIGRVTGVVLLDTASMPRWETPAGLLASFDEFTEVSLPPVTAVPVAGRTIHRYSIINSHMGQRGLPWGLMLDPRTGVISGNSGELLDDFSSPYDDTEIPVWQTPAGLLGEANEQSPVSLAVTSLPQTGRAINRYFTLKGALPWGLTLDPKSGAITGEVSELLAPEAVLPLLITPKPLWTVPAGSLGNYNEGQEMDLTLAAVSRAGTGMVSYVITAGGLPWGLTLGRGDGRITGINAELLGPAPVEYLDPYPKPEWNTASGSIGIFREFEAATVSIQATAKLGTNIARYHVIAGGLPWGMTLHPGTGVISGTADEIKLATEPVDFAADGPLWQTPTGSLGTLAVGQAVTLPLAAQGVSGRTVTGYYMLAEPFKGLPWGLVFSPSTGVISGTVDASATGRTFEFVIVAIDSAGKQAARTFTLAVN